MVSTQGRSFHLHKHSIINIMASSPSVSGNQFDINIHCSKPTGDAIASLFILILGAMCPPKLWSWGTSGNQGNQFQTLLDYFNLIFVSILILCFAVEFILHLEHKLSMILIPACRCCRVVPSWTAFYHRERYFFGSCFAFHMFKSLDCWLASRHIAMPVQSCFGVFFSSLPA